GVFRIRNVPQESMNPVVLIECPRLLFPFAREIIATAVRNGGFPPLLLDPVDFVGLYRQKMAQQQPAAASARRLKLTCVGTVFAPQRAVAESGHEVAMRRKFGFA